MRYKTLTVAFLISMLPLLSGCLYRLNILQGNIVTEETRAKLKVGMTKSQVIQQLGKPVLDNVFEENRWYYIYTQQRGNEKMIRRGIVLYFTGDRLTQIVQE